MSCRRFDAQTMQDCDSVRTSVGDNRQILGVGHSRYHREIAEEKLFREQPVPIAVSKVALDGTLRPWRLGSAVTSRRFPQASRSHRSCMDVSTGAARHQRSRMGLAIMPERLRGCASDDVSGSRSPKWLDLRTARAVSPRDEVWPDAKRSGPDEQSGRTAYKSVDRRCEPLTVVQPWTWLASSEIEDLDALYINLISASS